MSPNSILPMLTSVLSTEGIAPSLTLQEKNTFLKLVFQIKDKRRFKSLLYDFCQVCSWILIRTIQYLPTPP